MAENDIATEVIAPGEGLTACKDEIWKILEATDQDFVPPLSEREPTTLGELKPSRLLFRHPIQHVDFQLELHVIFARYQGRAVGFLSFKPDFTHDVIPNVKSAVLVDTIAVLPSWRRRGVARQLYNALLDWERLHEHEDLVLHTWSTNVPHERLIRSLGFEEIHRIPDERAPGIDTIIFHRKVASP